MKEPETFTLNGNTYNFNEATDAAKYYVMQLNSMIEERVEHQMKVDRLMAAEGVFSDRLTAEIESLSTPEEPSEEPSEEPPEVPAEP